MPSVQMMVHDVCSFGIFSMRTRHSDRRLAERDRVVADDGMSKAFRGSTSISRAPLRHVESFAVEW